MESKATATRFFPRSFYLFGLSFSLGLSVIHSQNQDYVVSLQGSLPAPTTPYWSMTEPHIASIHQSYGPYMEILYFNKELWCPR